MVSVARDLKDHSVLITMPPTTLPAQGPIQSPRMGHPQLPCTAVPVTP